MSQLNLTPEEDQMLLAALRTHAAQYQAMFGSSETTMLALIAKVEGQLLQPVPADIIEPTDEEVEAHFAAVEAATTKTKKTKVVEE
jgi:hypothetical protein